MWFKHTCSSWSNAFSASICAWLSSKSNTSRLEMMRSFVSDLGRGIKLPVSVTLCGVQGALDHSLRRSLTPVANSI